MIFHSLSLGFIFFFNFKKRDYVELRIPSFGTGSQMSTKINLPKLWMVYLLSVYRVSQTIPCLTYVVLITTGTSNAVDQIFLNACHFLFYFKYLVCIFELYVPKDGILNSTSSRFLKLKKKMKPRERLWKITL